MFYMHGWMLVACSYLYIMRARVTSYILYSSAGVGRTGAFIVLDTMLERLPQTHDIAVYECVQNMRERRMSMVQTVVRM